MIGFAGVGALLVGCFAPLLYHPLGSINYVAGDGVIVVVLAGIASYLIFTENYKWLWIPTVLAAALCTFTFVELTNRLMKAGKLLDEELAGNPFRGFADLAWSSVGYGWGWLFLLVGLGCLFATALMPTLGGRIAAGKSPAAAKPEQDEETPAWLSKALDEIKVRGQQAPSPRNQLKSVSAPPRAFGRRIR